MRLMSLYEVDPAIEEAWNAAIDSETGEIVNEEALAVFKELDKLDKQSKIAMCEECAVLCKNRSALETSIREEAQKLLERANSMHRGTETMEKCIANYLNGEKVETARVKISWRKSTTVEYTGQVEALPKECIRQKLPEVNKAELKKLLKVGTEIPGARLVTRNNMQIK